MKFDAGICTVRDWQLTDAEQLCEVANNPNVARYLRDRFPNPYRLADAREHLDRMAGQTSPQLFAIVVDGRIAGGIGCHPGADIERCSAEIGYWLGEPYWGRGITTAAVRTMLPYYFESQRLTRIWSGVIAEHTASRRVLEKCGFTLEGIARCSIIKRGVVHDSAIYALLREELEARNRDAAQ